MIQFDVLISELKYDKSPHYYEFGDQGDQIDFLNRYPFINDIDLVGGKGVYFFETSPKPLGKIFKPHPAVCISEAQDEKEARIIHKKIWNLNNIPFLIIKLPYQIRAYTGFNYSEEKTNEGLLDKIENKTQLEKLLSILKADEIDSGQIWKSSYAKGINPDKRVNKHLLKNLKKLGQVIRDKTALSNEVINALIGKFVYFSYLRDRNILTNEWMNKNNIDPQSVFSQHATVSGLKNLVAALDERFNGKIFPIEFEKEPALRDEHVQWISIVFSGGNLSGSSKAPKPILQLHLPFSAYDFECIPVETLSAIYEHFIFSRKEKGAIYTPEILADYLISEMESYDQLEKDYKILDPACGSGIFLVLVYRRLIEKEINRLGRRLKPKELIDILQKSIFGVERELDACYVTEFSLILTLLHFIEPRELEKIRFHFPVLHNRQIFSSDFFDTNGDQNTENLWNLGHKFDWIVGNPPWIELKPKTTGEKFAKSWMKDKNNKKLYPTGGNRVAEAFSWAVTELMNKDGIAGLVMPATSLFNLESKRYRKAFFKKNDVLEITNFANLREKLFDRRGTLPATTIIYRQSQNEDKPEIRHYAPFSINQIPCSEGKPWVITINENEIKSLSPHEALEGETFLWKTALWATPYDKRILEKICTLFPFTLGKLAIKNKWAFSQSAELRGLKNSNINEIEYIDELKGKQKFVTDKMDASKFRFSAQECALEEITDDFCYIRKRGGKKGLKIIYSPHIIISPTWGKYITYSDTDFFIPPRQFGISSNKNYSDHLKGIALYLNSNLAAYYLFFMVPEWGVFRQARRVSVSNIKNIAVPQFTSKQIEKLSTLHDELVTYEQEEIKNLISEIRQDRLNFDLNNDEMNAENCIFPGDLTSEEKYKVDKTIPKIHNQIQNKIDLNLYRLLRIPEDIRVVVEDFFKTRLPLDTPSLVKNAVRVPTEHELEEYACMIRDELDNYLMGDAFHRVEITYSKELIECIVEIVKDKKPVPVSRATIKKGDVNTASLFADLSNELKNNISQWAYVQKGLRLFDGPKIYIYKTPRLLDWSKTQAIIDAGDIIGELIPLQ
ncbi:MAG: N-6 DNA methylase [Desulfobacteraceae bacterium]|jgi:hypothetical protein